MPIVILFYIFAPSNLLLTFIVRFMIKIFSVFRVSVLNVSGSYVYYHFTNISDAKWFASHFEHAEIDSLPEVSLTDCDDDLKDYNFKMIKDGTSTFNK